jgi:hypothetical protein
MGSDAGLSEPLREQLGQGAGSRWGERVTRFPGYNEFHGAGDKGARFV